MVPVTGHVEPGRNSEIVPLSSSRTVLSHLSLLLLSGETQEPGHLLLPRRHQEQQRQRPAEGHEGRLRVLLEDGGTGGWTGGAVSVSTGDCWLSGAPLVCLAVLHHPAEVSAGVL